MRILVLVSMIILSSTAFGQDVIYLPDGSKIDAKVTVVTPSEIKYKKYSNLSGPEYIKSKNDVLMIIYENGEHEIFTKQVKITKVDSIANDFGKNFIAYNCFNLVFANMMISYERILKSGMIGFRIPFAVGFDQDNYGNDYSPNNIICGSGFDVNFYPFGQGIVRYFLSTSFEIASFYYRKYNYNNYYHPEERTMGMHYAALVKHGLLIQPSKHYNISTVLGLGFGGSDSRYGYQTDPVVTFEINIGCKF